MLLGTPRLNGNYSIKEFDVIFVLTVFSFIVLVIKCAMISVVRFCNNNLLVEALSNFASNKEVDGEGGGL